MDISYLKDKNGMDCFGVVCPTCKTRTLFEMRRTLAFAKEKKKDKYTGNVAANCDKCGNSTLLSMHELEFILKMEETEW